MPVDDLRTRTERHPLSMRVLARSAGIHYSTFSLAVNGRRGSADTIARIERTLAAPVWLYEDQGGHVRWTYDRNEAHEGKSPRRARWAREAVCDDGSLWNCTGDHQARRVGFLPKYAGSPR